jgi:hypothetical protein
MNPFFYWPAPRRRKARCVQSLISAAMRVSQELTNLAPNAPQRPVNLARWQELAASAAFWHQHAVFNLRDVGRVKRRRVRRYLHALRDAAIAAGWGEDAELLERGVDGLPDEQVWAVGAALFSESQRSSGGAE